MKAINTVLAILVVTTLGCQSKPENRAPFQIYMESWERISFSAPEIAEGKHLKWHVKQEANHIIKQNLTSWGPSAEVMLGKNIHVNEKGLEAEMDAIQAWLVCNGITDITFRLAMSKGEPPVVRICRNGKITNLDKKP